jgi:hypothetical protein
MKRTITFLCLIVFSIAIKAQIVPVRTVVSSTGKDTLIGTTVWAFSVGEPMIETFSAFGTTVTQGFHQPDGYSISPFLPYIFGNISIYPNPAKPGAQLKFYLKVDKAEINLLIFDASGKLYQKQTIQSYAGQTWHSLNTQAMAAGTYQVKVLVGDNKYIGKFVIIN